MGGVVSSIFGKKPKGPQPFRNPDYKSQGDLASDITRSAAYQAFFQPQQYQQTWQPGMQQWGDQGNSKLGGGQGKITGGQQIPGIDNSKFGGQGGGKLTGGIQGHPIDSGFQPGPTGTQYNPALGSGQNYGDLYNINQASFTPGQQIAGQLQSTVNPYQYSFDQYNPYHFNYGYNANRQVADAFAPQAFRLNNIYQQNLSRGLDQQAEDFNRRGLLQSGGLTEANRRFSEDLGGQFLNSLAGLAGQQAQTQTQAGQFGAQMQAQRQQQQAEELFRNVGANNQMAQNLAQLGFNQALSGRQAAVNEQLQGINSQQNTLDNLMRLYAMSAAPSAAQPGSKGLFGQLAGTAGAVIGGIYGGPAGAAAGQQIGSAASAPFSYGGFWS